MPYTVILHIHNEDPVMGEVEELPAATASFIPISNPRRVDGKDLHYVTDGVITVLFPIHRIVFIELVPSKEEEEIISFVRE